jgi:hypothetical protein
MKILSFEMNGFKLELILIILIENSIQINQNKN